MPAFCLEGTRCVPLVPSGTVGHLGGPSPSVSVTAVPHPPPSIFFLLISVPCLPLPGRFIIFLGGKKTAQINLDYAWAGFDGYIKV